MVPELKQSSNSMAVCESLRTNSEKKTADKKPLVLEDDEMKPLVPSRTSALSHTTY